MISSHVISSNVSIIPPGNAPAQVRLFVIFVLAVSVALVPMTVFAQSENSADDTIALHRLENEISTSKKESFALASEYIDLVSRVGKKELYPVATGHFLMGLSASNFDPADQEALSKEMRFLQLLVDDEEADKLDNLASSDIKKLADRIRMIWIQLDPTPVSIANERLIEHRQRIQTAQTEFTNPKSEIGIDERGEVWVRYGEPDKIFDKPFHISRGELYTFVSEFQFDVANHQSLVSNYTLNAVERGTGNTEESEESSDFSRLNQRNESNSSNQFLSAKIAQRLGDVIGTNPFNSGLVIWIYGNVYEAGEENLIFYFTEAENSVFKQVDTLDDWIPEGLYHSAVAQAGVDYSPALALQFLAYQRVMDLDPQLMDAYSKMEREIFNSPVKKSRSEIKQLARNFKAQNQKQAYKITENSPNQKSTEQDQIFEIPLEIHQYRFLDKNNRPIFTTFIESHPTEAFLNDFLKYKNQIIKDNSTDEMIAGELANRYKFEQGVELYDGSMQLLGRFRGSPTLEVDQQSGVPSIMLLDIPIPADNVNQVFFSRLQNKINDPLSDPTRIYPDEIRGLGKKIINQPKHFVEDDHGELLVGDLIVGFRRANDNVVRFPFIVSHNRRIPENENLVVHFEVYNLGKDSTFTDFEVHYAFKPEKKRSRIFGNNQNEFAGTLSFSSENSQFRESLEFDNLPLETGNYELVWTIVDLAGNQKKTRIIDVEIVEEKRFFSSRGEE